MKKSLLRFASFSARVLPDRVKQGFYQFKPLAWVVRKALNQAAPTGLTEVIIASGGAAGLIMMLDLQIEKDYWLGTYEVDLQRAVADLVEPDQERVPTIIYDIGANIGFITLLLAQQYKESGQIYAFEALPDNLERLRTHIEINGLASSVRIIPGAITDVTEPVHFLVGPSGAMGKIVGSAGRSDSHRESLEVQGICLDDFVYQDGNPPPQMIKMDIEGGEVLALKGMGRILTENRPLLLLELHGPEAARVAWETLTGAGYQICHLRPGYPRISSQEALDWKAYIVGMP